MGFNSDIENSIKVLKSGGTFLYPTDTIWGIGCDATNAGAVSKIYKIKEREFSKSLIVLIDSFESLKNYVEFIPENIIEILNSQTKPTTIIYQNAKNLASNAIAEDNSIAIRIPDDEFCKNLIKEFGKPIISTSANKSGDVAPQNFNEISNKIKTEVNYIVNWRQNDTKKSEASAIILINKDGYLEYLRK